MARPIAPYFSRAMSQLTIALFLFLLPLAYSPGPGNLFFAANGARFGFWRTMPANLGYHTATLAVTVAIGLGFDQIASSAPTLLAIVRYAGAAYVLYLAWRLASSGTSQTAVDARSAGFVDGAVLLLLNPKAYLIMALLFTQFGAATGPHPIGLVLWISVVFTLNNMICFLIYAGLGDRLAAQWRDPASARRLNLTFAAILLAVAIWMLLG